MFNAPSVGSVGRGWTNKQFVPGAFRHHSSLKPKQVAELMRAFGRERAPLRRQKRGHPKDSFEQLFVKVWGTIWLVKPPERLDPLAIVRALRAAGMAEGCPGRSRCS